VGTGNNVLIGGFIITGTQSKKVIIRAIAPSLPIPGVLADPTLELHGSTGQLIESNDNWGDSANKQEILNSLPPANDKESAIVATLAPGAYTAIVSGINGTTGIAVVEVYDLNTTANSKLANISTRAPVQTGNNILIGGFIVLGQQSQNVIVRALGPSLPLAGTLSDPTLELHDGNGTMFASNDNWRTDQEAAISATIPPSNDAESAIVATLQPGNYTAVVSGVNGTVGVGLVEVYHLP
jgi:hypothetical protein